MKRFLIGLAALAIVAAPHVSQAAKPTTSFDAGSVHVDQYGDGAPALVLIPGLTDSAAIWNAAIDRYSPAHRIYALTLPGFGGRAPIAAPMLDKVDADIAAFLPKADRPVLIGHSMGGHLALRLAAEHSGLIRGVIAVDGLPVFPGFDVMPAEQKKTLADQITSQMSGATVEQFQQFEKTQLLPYMTKPENINAVYAAGSGAVPAASAEYLHEMMLADLRPSLSNITVPVLELVPFDQTLDPFNPQAKYLSAADKKTAYETLLAKDKTAKVQIIDNSRHFIMFDQPKAFYDAVDAFLRSLPA